MSRQAILRPRRQLTLPRTVCEALGIDTGDSLDIEVQDGSAVLRPSKQRALDALSEIQAIFAQGDVTEREIQAEARRIRRQLNAEQYGRPS